VGLGTISRWDLGPLVGGTSGSFIGGTWGPFVVGGTQGPLISIGETWLLLLALQVVYNNCEILVQFLALL
jgi:hypothetical protein